MEALHKGPLFYIGMKGEKRMFNLKHFLYGREGTGLLRSKQIKFQKSVHKSKFTPVDMKHLVNDDYNNNNHDYHHHNNNEQYTYSIAGPYLKAQYGISYHALFGYGFRSQRMALRVV
jgi:hypothetical protein